MEGGVNSVGGQGSSYEGANPWCDPVDWEDSGESEDLESLVHVKKPYLDRMQERVNEGCKLFPELEPSRKRIEGLFSLLYIDDTDGKKEKRSKEGFEEMLDRALGGDKVDSYLAKHCLTHYDMKGSYGDCQILYAKTAEYAARTLCFLWEENLQVIEKYSHINLPDEPDSFEDCLSLPTFEAQSRRETFYGVRSISDSALDCCRMLGALRNHLAVVTKTDKANLFGTVRGGSTLGTPCEGSYKGFNKFFDLYHGLCKKKMSDELFRELGLKTKRGHSVWPIDETSKHWDATIMFPRPNETFNPVNQWIGHEWVSPGTNWQRLPSKANELLQSLLGTAWDKEKMEIYTENWTPTEIRGQLYWYIVQSAPFCRGSAAVANWMDVALAKKLGHTVPNTISHLDCYALSMPRDLFVERVYKPLQAGEFEANQDPVAEVFASYKEHVESVYKKLEEDAAPAG